MRRKALSPFTFQDGMHIPAGSWVCAPSRAVMLDPNYYSNPEQFDGYRFLDRTVPQETPRNIAVSSRYTDTGPKFLFWGHGKRAWYVGVLASRQYVDQLCSSPGRFYAAHTLKLMLSHIVLRYDIKQANKAARRGFAWRTTIVPRQDTGLLVQPRRSP